MSLWRCTIEGSRVYESFRSVPLKVLGFMRVLEVRSESFGDLRLIVLEGYDKEFGVKKGISKVYKLEFSKHVMRISKV